MFGYIIVHKPELKVREYETYKASYCGLCRSLKKRHGRIGQMTLSYDMTFLALLLTGLYEPETITGCERCIAHPVGKNLFLDAYAKDEEDQEALRRKGTDDSGQPEGTP